MLRYDSKLERLAVLGRPDLIEILIDHVIAIYALGLGAAPDKAAALLNWVVPRAAHLAARRCPCLL